MRVRSFGALLLLLGACASPNRHMGMLDKSSYSATLASPPPWEGSPVRVVVGPTLNYWRSVSWDDIGHPFRVSNRSEDSDGISIEVINQTDKTLRIDWERSTLTDSAGHLRRIVHSGVAPTAPIGPQPATLLPERSRISEIIYPADALEPVDGQWHHSVFFPTPTSDSSDAQLSLTLAVVLDGALVTVPQPISAHISATSTTTKSGNEWPRLLDVCTPFIGCGNGLICSQLKSENRCIPTP